MKPVLPVILVAVLLSSCAAGPPSEAQLRAAATEKARLEKRLAGLTPGKPKRCIPLRNASSPESFGENTLVFSAGRKRVYVTETRGSCDDVGRFNALITHPFGSELCRGDIARSADLVNGFSGGSCVIGEFVPYTR